MVKKSGSEQNKEEVKRFGKLFEDIISMFAMFKEDEKAKWIQVSVLFFSYLEPAIKLLNKKQ